MEIRHNQEIDCFISTLVKNPVREAYAKVALDYWTRTPQVKRLVVLDFGSDPEFLAYVRSLEMKPRDYSLDPPAFEPDGRKIEIVQFGDIGVESYFVRRIEAEKRATTPIYLMVDDDCIMSDRRQGWFENGDLASMIDLLIDRPDFAAIHPRAVNFASNVTEDGEVVENYNTGGVRLTRKGCGLDTLPIPDPLPADGAMNDDEVACHHMQDLGWRVGMARDVWFFHLGIQSTIWTHSRT